MKTEQTRKIYIVQSPFDTICSILQIKHPPCMQNQHTALDNRIGTLIKAWQSQINKMPMYQTLRRSVSCGQVIFQHNFVQQKTMFSSGIYSSFFSHCIAYSTFKMQPSTKRNCLPTAFIIYNEFLDRSVSLIYFCLTESGKNKVIDGPIFFLAEKRSEYSGLKFSTLLQLGCWGL